MDVILQVPKPAVKTFPVTGKTREELRASLNSKRFWARYHPHPAFQQKEKDGTVLAVRIVAKPVIEYPAWKDYAKAEKDLKKDWDKLLKFMKKHEEMHHKIFEKTVKDFAKHLGKAEDHTPDMVKARILAFFDTLEDRQKKVHDKFPKGDGHKIISR